MFFPKCKIYFFIVLNNYLELTQSLVEMPPPIEEDVITKSDSIIRNTFNRLFNNLKIKNIKESTKFKEYSSIQKYFTALALQDFGTLHQITQIVKVNNKNISETSICMEIINNLYGFHQLVEKNDADLTNNDQSVIAYILYFLKILKKLKESNTVDKEYQNINRNILQLINNKENKSDLLLKLHSLNESNIINENEFWEPSGRRIYKGERTKIKHFPFMAMIQIFNNFHCAGSIIKSDLIVTASSCLQLAWNNRFFRENPAFLSARVGSSFYSGGGEVVPVLEIYFHPEYNPKNLRNNICVLRLTRHLNFRKRSNRIKKIDFDRYPSGIPVTTPGITILGWGAKQHSPVIGNPWKNVLSFSVLDIYPLEDCQDVYSREYVTRKNFCAGFFSKGGGACNRDVGGPGIADGKLMGVISFGSPVCGTPDAPTVFTKLGYYSDWIEEIMEMDIPVLKKKTTRNPYTNPWIVQSYTSQKPTTFKIPPFTGENMSPIPISLIDNQLRIFDDNVFKGFLATVFHSEEITNLKDHKKDSDLEPTTNQGTKSQEEITETYTPVTDFDDILSEGGHKDSEVTINSEEIPNKPVVNDIDEQIEKLIENVDLENIVKEETKVTNDMKPINGSVVTLLYVSDDEKNGGGNNIPPGSIINDGKEEVYNGMSIPASSFQDFTRAKDKEESELPESDLLGLLSEAIGQVIPI